MILLLISLRIFPLNMFLIKIFSITFLSLFKMKLQHPLFLFLLLNLLKHHNPFSFFIIPKNIYTIQMIFGEKGVLFLELFSIFENVRLIWFFVWELFSLWKHIRFFGFLFLDVFYHFYLLYRTFFLHASWFSQSGLLFKRKLRVHRKWRIDNLFV